MNSNQHLIIFDLDETLIHSTESELEDKCDFRIGKYFTYIRPNVEILLSDCMKIFNIAVWSSATELYTKTVVQNIFPEVDKLCFIWSRDKCTYRVDLESDEFIWIKNLKKVKKLGFDLDKVIVVDDSPEKLLFNYGNLLRVDPFYGDKNDDELIHLMKYLSSLENEPNIRVVDKHRWKDQL